MHIDPIIGAYEQALGAQAVSSLAGRELIRSIGSPAYESLDRSVTTDRVHGAVFGLALGDVFAGWAQRHGNSESIEIDEIESWLARQVPANSGRVSAMTRVFEITAEAMVDDALRAPLIIVRELAATSPGMASGGRATGHATRRIQRGAQWFEAGPPSYGDAALPRAVAVGLRLHQQPELIGAAASFTTVVTHASRRAASCSAALAAIIAGLVARPEEVDPSEVVAAVVPSIDDDRVRTALGAMLRGADDSVLPFEPTAIASLRLALWCQQFGPDLAPILYAATRSSDADRATLAITVALHGAAGGMNVLPQRARHVERERVLMGIADRVAGAQPATMTVGDAEDRGVEAAGGADIWFLVDRSGSMKSISRFVVSGFDEFFTKQRAGLGEATVTVVQFDDKDPHDVIVDGLPLDRVPSIRDRYQPRGLTPLYDAVGLLLDRAERRGGDDADQLMVILSDGMENASTKWTRHDLFDRIADLRQRGWTFVFLGANQDSYKTGLRMAMPAGNVSNFRADESGVRAAYSGLDRTVSEWRGKARYERRRDVDQFWGDRKEAEELR